MKYLALLLATILLFCASAYIATAQSLSVSVTIPCSLENMIISKCVPEGYWEAEVSFCEYD